MNFSDLITLITESKIDNLDISRAYDLFKKEYIERTGYAWPFEKFLSRSYNWEFHGDDNGYVAIRRQKSGYVKLVGAAGSNKSKYLAMKELIKEPIWGVVTKDLYDLAIKIGMRSPTDEEKKLLQYMIPSSMLSNINIDDNTVLVNYKDVGTIEKFFIGSEEYFKKIFN